MPVAAKKSARPMTNWSSRNRVVTQPRNHPKRAPTEAATRRPTGLPPILRETRNPTLAPSIITPSWATLNTPARPASIVPWAARMYGTIAVDDELQERHDLVHREDLLRRAPTTSEKSRNSRIRASTMSTISLGTSAVRCMALAPTSSTAMPKATNGHRQGVATRDEADDDAEQQVVGLHALDQLAVDARDLDGSGEPRERATDDQRADRHAADPHAVDLRGPRVGADRPQLVAGHACGA